MTSVIEQTEIERACQLLDEAIDDARRSGAGVLLFEGAVLDRWRTVQRADPAAYSALSARLDAGHARELRARLRAAPEAPRGLPEIKSASALLSASFQPISWLIPGLLPEGLMLLAARPKVGKSWLALDIAIASATGGEVLGRPVERGEVLYLALEDNDRRMHSRLSILGADAHRLADLHYATSWPRGAEGSAAINSWIESHRRARLVVVDVLAKLRVPSESRDGYAQDYADVAALKPPPGVALIAVHHTRKAEADDPLDTISGTLGVAGAADCAWVLRRARGEDEAELHVVGRDLEDEGAYAVRFDRASCRWQWIGESWKVRISAERREILDALADGPLRPGELAKAIGKRENAVRYLLHAMTRDGHVDRGLDGKYRPINPRAEGLA